MSDAKDDEAQPVPASPARMRSLRDYRNWLYNELRRTGADAFGPIYAFIAKKKWPEAQASLDALPAEWQLDPETIQLRTFISFSQEDDPADDAPTDPPPAG